MKEIPGFEGYHATASGVIVSTRSGDAIEIQSRISKGYRLVTLKRNGRRERHVVSRLVAAAFHGPCPDGLQCRHLNGDSLDNRADNLRWGTPRENAQDAIRHGTLGPGMRARRRRLTEEQVIEIRSRVAAGEPSAAIARDFGVSKSYPKQVAAGKCWRNLNG